MTAGTPFSIIAGSGACSHTGSSSDVLSSGAPTGGCTSTPFSSPLITGIATGSGIVVMTGSAI